jgi:hypothetical protein
MKVLSYKGLLFEVIIYFPCLTNALYLQKTHFLANNAPLSGARVHSCEETFVDHDFL